jgi:hypothetical protein
MRSLSLLVVTLTGTTMGLLAPACSDHPACDLDDQLCQPTTVTSSGGGSAGQGGDVGGGGAQGGGGGDPCGGCMDPTPLCDEGSGTCVACLMDADCTENDAAKCEEGACVPCDDSVQCTGHANAEVCDAGSCVECALGDESACVGGQTCDLVAKDCVNVPSGSVQNCEACTNDAQCETGHKCISMDFEMSFHGYYCLEEPSPGCARPFGVTINKPSISGMAAANYCGIEEDLATCEAVLALLAGWVCSGTPGMCGPLAMPEVSVPGALCRQVGLLPDQCTYACAGPVQCPTASPQDTCGGMPAPTWCGG